MTSALHSRALGRWRVSAIGLGCMNFSHGYGPGVDDAQAERVLLAALDAGVDWFDTAALYGFGANERLVGRVLKPHRDHVVLCSKGGLTGEPVGEGGALQRVIDGRPASLRRHCEASLQRLGTDRIDLYYLHRWDKSVPIEESVGEMARLRDEGKIVALGLSEVSGPTLRRAHREATIAAVQTEYSLWSRNAELSAKAACEELGVALVAFSPVGRGFLAGAVDDVDSLPAGDLRRGMPRFQPEAFARNRKVLADYRELAREAGCTPAQLALGWLLAQGDGVLPIPGTTRVDHLHDDLGAAATRLDADMLARAAALFDGRIVGDRYGAQSQREVDTEPWPSQQ